MIRIDKDYIINVDSENYIACVDLHKEYTDKKGNVKKRYDTIGYYSSLYKALEGIREYKARKCLGEGEKSLQTALNSLKTIDKEFAKAFKEVIRDGKY